MGMGGFIQGLGAEKMDGFEIFGAELSVEEDELERGVGEGLIVVDGSMLNLMKEGVKRVGKS